MQLKASVVYALRAVIYLAMEEGTVSSKKISEGIAVPRDYLIQLFQLLRKANIAEAKAGKTGGYLLAKDPSQITFLEIINAIGNGAKTKSMTPEGSEDEVVDTASSDDPPIIEGIHKTLELAFESYDAYLDSITIDMLVRCAKDQENIDRYLADRLAQESRRLEERAESDHLFRGVLSGLGKSIPLPDSTMRIPFTPHPFPATAAANIPFVAAVPDISHIESKSPAACIEWKLFIP